MSGGRMNVQRDTRPLQFTYLKSQVTPPEWQVGEREGGKEGRSTDRENRMRNDTVNLRKSDRVASNKRLEISAQFAAGRSSRGGASSQRGGYGGQREKEGKSRQQTVVEGAHAAQRTQGERREDDDENGATEGRRTRKKWTEGGGPTTIFPPWSSRNLRVVPRPVPLLFPFWISSPLLLSLLQLGLFPGIFSVVPCSGRFPGGWKKCFGFCQLFWGDIHCSNNDTGFSGQLYSWVPSIKKITKIWAHSLLKGMEMVQLYPREYSKKTCLFCFKVK